MTDSKTLYDTNLKREFGHELERILILLPDFCPVCLVGVHPLIRYCEYDRQNHPDRLQTVFLCPRKRCRRLFIGTYQYQLDLSLLTRRKPTRWTLLDLAPITAKKHEFDPAINKLSAQFVEIYNEAAAAEAYKLNHVSGPGFRKALEFLLKDYLKHRHPDKVEQIEKMLLGGCIEEFVKRDQLKAVAKRAAWLGNDETHYRRRWRNTTWTILKCSSTFPCVGSWMN